MSRASPERYTFEGEELTISQIRAQVPALSVATIARMLGLGINTRQGMLTYNPQARMRAGGVAAAAGGMRKAVRAQVDNKTEARRKNMAAARTAKQGRKATEPKTTAHE